jgi:hypothetical protein
MTFSSLKPQMVPNFGRVCIKLNIYLNGEPYMWWGMVIALSFRTMSG